MTTALIQRARWLATSLLFAAATAWAQAPTAPIELHVDASRIGQRVLQVTQTMPVQPGPLVLHYPRFLPGTHGPYNDVSALAGLVITDAASGARIAWQRDTTDPYAFALSVPAGTRRIRLSFQHIATTDRNDARVTLTPVMANVQWNTTVLYPKGADASSIRYAAQLKLPEGWDAGTALVETGRDAEGIRYRATSLETLVDSPVFAGRHSRRVALSTPSNTQTPPVNLFLMGDDPGVIEASDEQIKRHSNLVAQADALFGSRHFRNYTFLLALSETMSGVGLEHHESSENGVRTGYFKDWKLSGGHSTGGVGNRELLPHEYVHSWNGKYRRPQDLFTPDFNLPMRNSLLWVYEGQTQYWGRVLAARSGLTSSTQTLALVAQSAAAAEHRAGRTWRNLQDTTNEGTIAGRRNKPYANWQRTGGDYYEESTLIWLDADTLIRELSGGKRSLDDFAKSFFGPPAERHADGSIRVRPFAFADVVAALQAVQPNPQAGGWAQFLRDRLDTNDAPAPLAGLQRAGYTLTYVAEQHEVYKAEDRNRKQDDFGYSLGLQMGADGKVNTVVWGSPAFEAGLNAATTLLAVNGVAYSAERLRDAIKANTSGKAPIELIAKDGDHFQTIRLDYRGGLRYPSLKRLAGTPDRLIDILSAK